MDNNKTVTMKMSAPIATPDGSYELSFRVSVRCGASGAMMAETVAHFLHAAEMLAQGKPGDECGEEFTERSEYELSEHGQNRVVVYGDIQVYTASGLRIVPENVFSETTSAQGFVNFVWTVMDGMGRIAQLDKGVKFNGAIKSQKAKSELDNHFGERKPQAQKQSVLQRADHQPTNPRLYAEVYDYLPQERRLEVEQRCVGQKVGLRLGAIERELAKFDNGETADRIRFWSPTGDYAYSATICVKVDERDNNYTLKAFKDRAADLWKALPATGYKIPCGGIAVFKLNQGKGDYAHKVYWNLLSIVADEQLAPEETQAQQLDRPPIDYDDIPF
ncbi:hypothetical protein LCGC14_1574020 [marine sediment metagenome]|uniref:Uncharacterized protein n=1 Tax=marine sediment metagenome TaxID=412755 RepID=A0A0F9IIX8_9ZZZZ